MAMNAPYYLSQVLAGNPQSVHIMATDSSLKFFSPLALELLNRRKRWEPKSDEGVEHVVLARDADLVIIMPASADILARVAAGRASDSLSLLVLATRAPVFFVPAMNSLMWESKVVQRNCGWIRELGHHIISPKMGVSLSSDVEESGAMADFNFVEKFIGNDLLSNGLTHRLP